MTKRELELEAEIVRLRDALYQSTGCDWPFTPTALLELIEKAEKKTIERHCAELERLDYWYSARAIRALPTDQIKLECIL